MMSDTSMLHDEPCTRRNARQVVSLVAVFTLMASAAIADNTHYVNPFIGTGGHGHTFPGATTPYGMVQLSPDTRTLGWDACAGYHHSDSSILGFSHTHLSGTGIGDLGDVLFMPAAGDAQVVPGPEDDPDAGYRSRFIHDNERAEPGYYRVHLADEDIDAELTATPRAGFHRYHYPASKPAQLVIDLAHTIHGHHNPRTELKVINDREIVGLKQSRGWAEHHYVYFHAKFNRPFTAKLYANTQEKQGDSVSAEGGAQAVLTFEAGDDVVLAKVGISAVDYDGARKNLEAEIADWDFEKVRSDAKLAWQKQLDKINVKGGAPDQRVIFYTALYHTAISPYLFSDADGRYRGVDQEIHTATDEPVYTVFSLWDTFRAFHPLLTITDPDRNAAFIRTLLTHYDQGGVLPKWELAGNYTGTMIGYHAVPVIVDAYVKGRRDFDVEKAYRAVVASAHYDRDVAPQASDAVRTALVPAAKRFNDELGFIPSDQENESVSQALEFAYNDWCIAQFATALGKSDDTEKYFERARRYRQYFDTETGFMRGLNTDRTWSTPFNPRFSEHRRDNYTEGNAWQWTWFAPHDVPGLVDLMGGPAPFIKKLDQLFTEDSTIDGANSSVDISGLIGQYAHGNEPSHHIAYLYNYVGQPWKTQRLVDQILTTLYHNDPDGLSGNEDCGQMSAWYLLNAMGFYQVSPGDPTYSIGRPLFDEVTIQQENGKTFTLRAINNSPENRYVQSVKLNGDGLSAPFFRHAAIVEGGVLELEMGPWPEKRHLAAKAGAGATDGPLRDENPQLGGND
ncbi:GH92 family glycosyl hydrolase [Botrimarina mediterranea]|uniref:Glycosyl hydrolase family 92 n=1 Tax=Botrimarina mediterranea TaxID=2528022 RepID=A0A518K9P6_9BACT|nr:GH92 family glycosyl hydrolase [Botrimarina mediterranea]QDV74503.1 Glycosyl hydrolase family 92 [Botrimarina mediterranea]QDV79143.1 Glycosyl hydrolase family 92 [Planctomycetes bacterium K2D]